MTSYIIELSTAITPELLKAKYLALVESGADTAILTREYLEQLETFRGREYTAHGADGKETRYRYEPKRETEERFASVVQQLVAAKMSDVKLYIRGSWVWIEGDSRPHLALLKALGCTFNGKRTKETGRGVWNWSPGQRRRIRNNMSYGQIQEKYGNEELRQ